MPSWELKTPTVVVGFASKSMTTSPSHNDDDATSAAWQHGKSSISTCLPSQESVDAESPAASSGTSTPKVTSPVASRDDVHYPMLLRHAGPDKKALCLPSLSVSWTTAGAHALPSHPRGPVETAHAWTRKQMGQKAPSSKSSVPAVKAATHQGDDAKTRLRRQHLEVQRKEMLEQVAALRQQLYGDDLQHCPETVQRWQVLKGALELSLQGIASLLDEPNAMRTAVAEPALPEIIAVGSCGSKGKRDRLIAVYKHAVRIEPWRRTCRF